MSINISYKLLILSIIIISNYYRILVECRYFNIGSDLSNILTLFLEGTF